MPHSQVTSSSKVQHADGEYSIFIGTADSMRLLHAKTLALKDFLEDSVPLYAIISHRWGDDEVSYSEFANSRKNGKGWVKIERACQIAQEYELDWVWIDTCCIDKRSSAELSEAINSMFEWYKRSKICFAFLSDVDDLKTSYWSNFAGAGIEQIEDLTPFFVADFHRSVWFTRGWTLQELLAPQHLIFFNSNFDPIGTKETLSTHIEGISRIGKSFLLAERDIHQASIAERMLWASRRQTTRPEDQAYCLLGIFDVNMPLLYGERGKAFLRLQEQIISQSDDESIFVWEGTSQYGLFASEPADFWETSRGLLAQNNRGRRHYELTNRGIRFTVRLPRTINSLVQEYEATRALLPLNCYNVIMGERRFVELVVLVYGNATTKVMKGWLSQTRYDRIWGGGYDKNRFGDVEFILQDHEDGEEWHVYFPKTGSPPVKP